MGFLDVGPSVNWRTSRTHEFITNSWTYLDLCTFLGAPISDTKFSLDKYFSKFFRKRFEQFVRCLRTLLRFVEHYWPTCAKGTPLETDKDAMDVFFTPGSIPPSTLSARKSEVNVPFVVRYCGKHHELVNALINHLCELIQAAEVGQNVRHDLEEITSDWSDTSPRD